MRVVFFGTPTHAVPYVDVVRAEHDLVAVVTQPDRPQGRTRVSVPPPVKEAAVEAGVPVYQPAQCGCDELYEELSALRPDLFVVTAYGQILPCRIIGLPALGAINVHYSLLPRLRGPAPVQHAILQGLTETGVTVQYVAEQVDRGDIVAARPTSVLPEDRTDTLTARLTILGCGLLREVLGEIAAGRAFGQPQRDEDASYAPLLTKATGRVDWTRSAVQVDRLVRGCYPWPIAWCDGKVPLRVHVGRCLSVGGTEGIPGTIVELRRGEGVVIACGNGTLIVTEVQPAGRRRMSAEEYIRGARLQVGDALA